MVAIITSRSRVTDIVSAKNDERVRSAVKNTSLCLRTLANVRDNNIEGYYLLSHNNQLFIPLDLAAVKNVTLN